MISLLVATIAGATCSDAYCRNRTAENDALASCLYWPENSTIVWRARMPAGVLRTEILL